MAAPVTIREMELDDLPAVFALGERLFTAERWPVLYRTWDRYELASFFASDGDTCFVAERAGRIVGFLLGTIIAKRRTAWTYGWIVWLGVAPGTARSGVGRRLVDRATEAFVEEGARMLIIDTDAENEPAIRFFEKLGFAGRRDHLYFTRNLAQRPAQAKGKRARPVKGRTVREPGAKPPVSRSRKRKPPSGER